MKPCAIIPTHNHYKALGTIVQHLKNVGLPVVIIDDGSSEPARSYIAALQNNDTVTIRRFNSNRGKGAAVKEGFRRAINAGFTHAVQIDADGQHDIEALPRFLQASTSDPEALISGQPIYDHSIPVSRKIGRWVTHIWVWLETLSFRITDSMCGFRVYPLAPVKKLLDEEQVGDRMEFDTDIMVRLFWRGVRPVMLPVKVVYPPGNASNFDLWRDNWRISKMHARLFLAMLSRLPQILTKRPPKLSPPSHWSDFKERGAYLGIKFCTGAYRLLGRSGCQIIMTPIILYFYFTGTQQRVASHKFLERALKRPVTFRDSLRHYMNFAVRALDVFGAWSGHIQSNSIVPTNPSELKNLVNDPQGRLFVVAHMGNADVARATLDKKTRERLTILVHTRHAENYNRVLRKLYPDAAFNLFQVTEMGPETIIELKQRIEKGEWVVIAGDRTSVLSKDRQALVSFLGEDAAFPQGPWILGALLECPVHLLFCMQNNEHYDFTVEPFADKIDIPRHEREKAIRSYVTRYAKRLEHYAALAPHQWYNFYDFWAHTS